MKEGGKLMKKEGKSLNSIFEQIKAIFIKNKLIVVDIGSDKVKAIEATQKGDNILIESFVEIDEIERYFTGKDITDYEGVINDISRVIKIADFKGKKVDLIYNSNQLQAKLVKVPDMSEKDVREFVELEYHKAFSNVSLSTHILDYLPLGAVEEEEKNEQHILLAALPIVESAKIMKSFETKQLEVNSIETNIHALSNALWLTEGNEEYKMILHVGKEYSMVLFAKGEVPLFYRVFSFGYDQLSRKIQEGLKTSLGSVDNVLKTHGFEKDDMFRADFDESEYEFLLKDSFSSFINEVYRSISYIKMQSKFDADKVYLSGGVANMIGVKEYIEENLAMEVERWQFSEIERDGKKVTVKDGEILGPEYALALGLTIRGWM